MEVIKVGDAKVSRDRRWALSSNKSHPFIPGRLILSNRGGLLVPLQGFNIRSCNALFSLHGIGEKIIVEACSLAKMKRRQSAAVLPGSTINGKQMPFGKKG